MRRIRPLTRTGLPAMGAGPDVKLTYIRDVLGATTLEEFIDATIPLFVNKDPQTPIPPGETT
jgi:hypothetical protein